MFKVLIKDISELVYPKFAHVYNIFTLSAANTNSNNFFNTGLLFSKSPRFALPDPGS